MFIRVKDAICQRKEKKTRETNDKNVIIVFLLIVWAQTSNWRLFNMHICFKIYLLLLYKVCQLGFFSLQLFSCTFYQAFLVLLILASNGLIDCPNCCWVFFPPFLPSTKEDILIFQQVPCKSSSHGTIIDHLLERSQKQISVSQSADSNTYDIAWYRGILSSVIMKRKRSIRTGHPRQWQIKSTELVTSIRVFPTANIFLSVRFRKLLFAIRQKDLIFVVIQLIFTDISIVFSPHSYRVPSLPA